MAPVDPTQLLKALNPLLGPTGAILGSTEATRIASLMKDATKMVIRCIYLNILKLDTPKDALEKFLSIGGWDTLNEWLQDFKEGENDPMLSEILKVYKNLPVSVEILKKNNAAKTIKQLCKSDNENVKILANTIFDEWMKKVKNNNNNTAGSSSTDPKVKKKKKDKEKGDNDKSDPKTDKGDSIKNNVSKSDKAETSKNSDKSESKSDKLDPKTDIKSDKSKTKDAKSSSHHHSSHYRHHSGEKRPASSSNSSSHDRKSIEESSSSSSSNPSAAVEDVVSVRKGSGLKLHIKLNSDKEKSEKTDSERKRPSTVKIPRSNFRSTGLEEENILGKPTKLSGEKQPPPKRTSTDNKSEPPVKKSRLHMPPPLSVPSPHTMVTSGVTTPTSTSPTSPGEMHGKIKLIPARPKPSNHSIHDSTGFMDSLLPAPRTYGAFKKKKKAMAAAATNGKTSPSTTSPSTPTGKVPFTPPSPLSPTTAVARSLPAVPSFYKDTQAESEPSPEDEPKERTPSPVEGDDSLEPTIKDDTKDDTTPVQMEIDNDDITGDYDPEDKERSLSPDSLLAISKETKGLLTTGPTLKKKKKKTVHWKEEHELKEVFYFELDEDERVNVNRAKDSFDQAKKMEMINDRRVIETSRRLVNDNMMEQIAWYRPKLIAGAKEIDYGKESTEKNIQKVREQGVLQALYFNRDMLPDGPQEPDLMHEEVVETKTIPLEDVSGGDEFLYNYDQHPEAVKNAPPTDPLWQQQQHPHPPPPHGPPPHGPPHGPPMGPPNTQPPMPPPPPMLANMPPGLNLPPELMGLIAQIQNMPPDQSGPVMAQVQQMLNNIMGGNSDQSFELQQLHQLMNAQMGIAPDGMIPGPPPMMVPPMGMPPNGPPMGPRPTGLLGNAPPGFIPQRPMGPGPPNRFGVPGPGQQGNWNDQQGNWNDQQGNWNDQQGNWNDQQGNWNDGPPMGPGGPGRQNNWGQRRRGGPRNRGRGGTSRNLCRHFASGSCKLGSDCGFLHPGINGPPLKKDQPVDS